MQHLFKALTDAISGGPALALAAAFAWGVLSILLSPCHLASIPMIIGFVDDQDNVSSKRALSLSLLFSVGILLSIALIGLVTALAGRIMGDIGAFGNYIVAVVFFAVGLQLLGVLPSPWSKPEKAAKKVGTWSALVLGLLFGIALGPCTFAFMAPMLGVTFKIASTSPGYAILLLTAYAFGHCGIIAAAGTSAGAVQKYMEWNRRSNGAIRVRRVCGVLVIAAGLYGIYAGP